MTDPRSVPRLGVPLYSVPIPLLMRHRVTAPAWTDGEDRYPWRDVALAIIAIGAAWVVW